MCSPVEDPFLLQYNILMKSEFDTWFEEYNTWGLSYDDLMELSYAPGHDMGDEVFVSETDSVLTRFMCHNWINIYLYTKTGWEAHARLTG